MIGRMRNFAPSSLWDRCFRQQRSQKDYATHVPILIGLAGLREIRSVIEFGCGYYSTLTFLNRSPFSHLERLESLENDTTWAEKLQESAQEDRRWTLKVVQGDIANFISNLDLEPFDLLLIDDSVTAVQRTATIDAVVNKRPQHPSIVIHDFEVEEYRNAARGFGQVTRFRAYNPETGLVANTPIDADSLISMDRLLKEQAKTLQPDDVEGWVSAFRSSRTKDASQASLSG